MVWFSDYAANRAKKWPQRKVKWSESMAPPDPLVFCAYDHLVRLMIQYSDDQPHQTAEPAYTQLPKLQSMLQRNADLEDAVIAIRAEQMAL